VAEEIQPEWGRILAEVVEVVADLCVWILAAVGRGEGDRGGEGGGG
jgi:hypothetical protein